MTGKKKKEAGQEHKGTQGNTEEHKRTHVGLKRRYAALHRCENKNKRRALILSLSLSLSPFLFFFFFNFFFVSTPRGCFFLRALLRAHGAVVDVDRFSGACHETLSVVSDVHGLCILLNCAGKRQNQGGVKQCGSSSGKEKPRRRLQSAGTAQRAA
jgi:hypothetical protein